MKKPKFELMKVYKDRAALIREYGERERMNLQDALDEIILTGIKVKRLLPANSTQSPESTNA
jgi:hypothetical protein